MFSFIAIIEVNDKEQQIVNLLLFIFLEG